MVLFFSPAPLLSNGYFDVIVSRYCITVARCSHHITLYSSITVWYNTAYAHRTTDFCSAYGLNDASTRVPTAFCVGLVDFCCCESCGDKCPDYLPLFSDIMSAACSDPATK